MESPPSSSSWSQAFILSDDSGLLLTNGSSTTSSFESRSSRKYFHFEDSDCEEKSLSQDDSLDGMSDIMCGENFNTLKKGPHWTETKQSTSPIEPPPEFQDKPVLVVIEEFCERLCSQILRQTLSEFKSKKTRHNSRTSYLLRSYTPSDFAPFSPRRLQSRLSSSHSSLSVPTARRVDDSTFITQAVSHDTLSDAYSTPFDGESYAVPVDVVRPQPRTKRGNGAHRKRRRNTSSGCREEVKSRVARKAGIRSEKTQWSMRQESKRHSVACTSAPIHSEPIHMTLTEVRQYLQTLYSSSSESECKDKMYKQKAAILVTNNNKYSGGSVVAKENVRGSKKTTFMINLKNKKVKDSSEAKHINLNVRKEEKRKKANNKFFNFKQTLCNMFRFRRFLSPDEKDDNNIEDVRNSLGSRALPPLPTKEAKILETDEQILDFATSIQRVKDYGWYWGPISSEAAEKILSNEPDGSFIVRDSSDDHYIFSLTFKLNNCVRHVRIEHDQGNFSFGSCAKFKSQTIVEFIENAVEHSRSGRYLFFLHRRPVIGPVRVQLLHPVSRFKQVQSLQHMCRFVIHKNVRRDLIPDLPLPRRMIDYLNTPHYYSEHFVDLESGDESQRGTPTESEVRGNGNDYVQMENTNL